MRFEGRVDRVAPGEALTPVSGSRFVWRGLMHTRRPNWAMATMAAVCAVLVSGCEAQVWGTPPAAQSSPPATVAAPRATLPEAPLALPTASFDGLDARVR